jgi:hypothetical protein
VACRALGGNNNGDIDRAMFIQTDGEPSEEEYKKYRDNSWRGRNRKYRLGPGDIEAIERRSTSGMIGITTIEKKSFNSPCIFSPPPSCEHAAFARAAA